MDTYQADLKKLRLQLRKAEKTVEGAQNGLRGAQEELSSAHVLRSEVDARIKELEQDAEKRLASSKAIGRQRVAVEREIGAATSRIRGTLQHLEANAPEVKAATVARVVKSVDQEIGEQKKKVDKAVTRLAKADAALAGARDHESSAETAASRAEKAVDGLALEIGQELRQVARLARTITPDVPKEKAHEALFAVGQLKAAIAKVEGLADEKHEEALVAAYAASRTALTKAKSATAKAAHEQATARRELGALETAERKLTIGREKAITKALAQLAKGKNGKGAGK